MFNVSMVGSYSYTPTELDDELDRLLGASETSSNPSSSNTAPSTSQEGEFPSSSTATAAAHPGTEGSASAMNSTRPSSPLTHGESGFLEALAELEEAELQPRSPAPLPETSESTDTILTRAECELSYCYSGSLSGTVFLASLSKTKAKLVVQAYQLSPNCLPLIATRVKISLKRLLAGERPYLAHQAHDIIAIIRQGMEQNASLSVIEKNLASKGMAVTATEISKIRQHLMSASNAGASTSSSLGQ